MREIDRAMNKYFRDDGYMHFFGDKKIAQEVADFFSYGEKKIIDAPDMVIFYNGKCLAVEHFEFDCYKNGRGGSENRKERARINRVIQASPSSENGNFIHDQIEGKSSYEQYIKNVAARFSEHYLKIPSYKKNLINKGILNKSVQLKFAFLIEDVSPLGSLSYNGKGMSPVILALSKEFLEYLHSCTDIDYVIACSSVNSEKHIWLIIREELDKYDSDSIDYASMNFFDCIPQVVYFDNEVPID